MTGTFIIILSLMKLSSMVALDNDNRNSDETVADVSNVQTLVLLKQLQQQLKHLEDKNNALEDRMEKIEVENDAKDLILRDMQVVIKDLAFQNHTNKQSTHAQDIKKQNTVHDDVNVSSRPRRQTIPRISFSAYLSSTNSNMSPGQPIKFDRVLINDGAGYNAYTGAFTAPVSGTYLFSFHFDARVHTFVRLNVDGVNKVDAVANPHTNTQNMEVMSSNTVIIHVGIGQAVLVEVYDVSGEVASSDKYRLSTFCGVLLYPEL